MGICQSIGGAATSGRGLTGRQVAEALAATAAIQRKSYRERFETEETFKAEISNCLVGTGTLSFDKIDSSHYDERRVVKLQVPNKEGIMETVTVHEYAPEVFRFLRQLYGLTEYVFADEWALPDERLHMELGEGRSMALFLKSKSMDLICKTISEEELNVLICILQQYVEHIAHNSNTLLIRFLMLLRVEVEKEVGFILCCGDVFACCHTLNEKWDLKGRKPKPGKYLHFPKLIRHSYEHSPYSIKTAREMMDLSSWVEPPGGDVVGVEMTDKDKLTTRKDKDLTRLFWLEKGVRDKLLQALMLDYEFLNKAGLMDYSLLIGVTYNESKKSGLGKCIQSMRMTHPIGSERDASVMEVRPSSQLRKTPYHHEFRLGISSLFEQEMYFVGIIDVLTTYSWKKKTANFCKSFLWKSETLSTIPPVEYYKRILEYTGVIFPEVCPAHTRSCPFGGDN